MTETNPHLGFWANELDPVDLDRLAVIMAHDYDEARRTMTFDEADPDQMGPEFQAMRIVALKSARWLAALAEIEHTKGHYD